MRGKLTRTMVALGVAGAVTVIAADQVAAGAGDPPRCVGDSVSANTRVIRPYGQFISGVARDTRGLGDEVALLKAGLISDDLYPNTCND